MKKSLSLWFMDLENEPQEEHIYLMVAPTVTFRDAKMQRPGVANSALTAFFGKGHLPAE